LKSFITGNAGFRSPRSLISLEGAGAAIVLLKYQACPRVGDTAQTQECGFKNCVLASSFKVRRQRAAEIQQHHALSDQG